MRVTELSRVALPRLLLSGFAHWGKSGPHRGRWLSLSVGALVVLHAGCGDGPTVPPASVPSSLTAASPTSIAGVVGEAVSTLPSVVVSDQRGDPMLGVPVTFAVTAGSGGVSGVTAFTDANGVATVGSWTLGPTAGENTLTATAGSLNPVVFVAIGQAGAAAGVTKSAGDEQTGPVATALPVAPAVVVTDLLDNPVAGATVVFEVASGGGSVTGDTAVSNSAGVAAVGGWTLGTVPGPNTLTATMGDATVAFSATAVAGEPAEIVKHDGDNQSATVGQTVPIPPAVRITDMFGNPVSGVPVIFAVASGDGSATGTSVTTGSNGVATIGSWTVGTAAGVNTLEATAGPLAVTFAATGVAGPAAGIVKVAGDGQSAGVDTDVAVPPSVRLIDEHGNDVEGVTVTFTVTLGDGSVAGAVQVTGADGIATVGSWTLGPTPGDNELTATAGSLSAVFAATGTP